MHDRLRNLMALEYGHRMCRARGNPAARNDVMREIGSHNATLYEMLYDKLGRYRLLFVTDCANPEEINSNADAILAMLGNSPSDQLYWGQDPVHFARAIKR
jgi:hypothetical protein